MFKYSYRREKLKRRNSKYLLCGTQGSIKKVMSVSSSAQTFVITAVSNMKLLWETFRFKSFPFYMFLQLYMKYLFSHCINNNEKIKWNVDFIILFSFGHNLSSFRWDDMKLTVILKTCDIQIANQKWMFQPLFFFFLSLSFNSLSCSEHWKQYWTDSSHFFPLMWPFEGFFLHFTLTFQKRI